MKRKIIAFHQDESRHWVADLECGHSQPVRHKPPWINRPWVLSARGRSRQIGREMQCRFCDIPPSPPS